MNSIQHPRLVNQPVRGDFWIFQTDRSGKIILELSQLMQPKDKSLILFGIESVYHELRLQVIT